MISEKSWDMLTEQMFDEAYLKFTETDTHKDFRARYDKILQELLKKYDNATANKLNAYLFEFDMMTKNRAKELYIMGMKDAVLLLKKMNVLM